MTESVTIEIDGDLFHAAKKVFQARCGLQMSDQEFVNHAMQYISENIQHENQLQAMKMLGKSPIIISHEELSEIMEKIQRLQYSNLPPYTPDKTDV
ncbi:MAG: hypothetical protein OXF60_07640 [Gammaproteobacteria bacterium]|nr:hypothetical protein [Gammaproteobacteria bacterium]